MCRGKKNQLLRRPEGEAWAREGLQYRMGSLESTAGLSSCPQFSFLQKRPQIRLGGESSGLDVLAPVVTSK